ncbi:MAG: hypothetical protein ACYCVZ_03500 [Streptosporangiaceae bacterium]
MSVLVGVAVTAGAPLAQAAQATQRSAGVSALMRSSSRGSGGYRLVSQRLLPHGLVLTTWRRGAQTASFAGPRGSVILFNETSGRRGAAGSASASLTPPPMPVGGAMARTPTQAAELLYEEAVAVGTPVAAARQMAFGLRSGSTSNGTSAVGSVSAMSKGTIYNSGCAHTTGDAGNAWGTSCLEQKMAPDSEPNQVYTLDTLTTSGNDNDWYCALTGLLGKDYYRYSGSYGNHGLVTWKPASTVPEGSPKTYTASLGYNGTGVSVSQTAYPNNLNPMLAAYNGQSPTSFGDQWRGGEMGKTVVGAPGADLTHIWSSGSIDAGVSVVITWC